MLRAYGAEVVITPTAVDHDSPESYYSVSSRLAEEIPGGFKPDQYSNMANPQAHYDVTAPEIWEQTGGEIDAIVISVGTGGTISGVGRWFHEHKREVKIVGVDPEGLDLHGEGRLRAAPVSRRGDRQGHVAGDDRPEGGGRVDPRLGPRLVRHRASARARGGHPRRRLLGLDRVGGDAAGAAPRPRRDRAGDAPGLRPVVHVEVLRRQLDARARLRRAAGGHADGGGGDAREARQRPPRARHDRGAREGRRGDRHDAALRHLTASRRARRHVRVARRRDRLAAGPCAAGTRVHESRRPARGRGDRDAAAARRGRGVGDARRRVRDADRRRQRRRRRQRGPARRRADALRRARVPRAPALRRHAPRLAGISR